MSAEFVFVDVEQSGWRARRAGRRSGGLAEATCSSQIPSSVADEVAAAVESARVLDLLGRALVLPDYRDLEHGNSLAQEAAFEAWREAQALHWGAGLVSVPTSRTPRVFRMRSARMAQAAGEALRDHLGSFLTGTDAGRVSKLRRAVGFSARVHCAEVDLSARCLMVTLTYRDGSDWRPMHVAGLVMVLRKWCARRHVAFRYCWVAELQKRGAIHYHLALWLPDGVRIPRPDEEGWWGHGMTNITVANSAVGYLMKYLSKGNKATDHQLPGGARSYGCGGLGQSMRLARRWLSLPGFIRARADVATSRGWRRAPGGGWADPDGVIWRSEYQRTVVGGANALLRVCDHGRPYAFVGCPVVGRLQAEHAGPFCFVPGANP